MLLLTRRTSGPHTGGRDGIVVMLPDGRRVRIVLVATAPGRALLGVEADRDLPVWREELIGPAPSKPRRMIKSPRSERNLPEADYELGREWPGLRRGDDSAVYQTAKAQFWTWNADDEMEDEDDEDDERDRDGKPGAASRE